ncbi:MAG: 50S ribosomal protein L17, partial [Candidatus Omnitrophota bacterium]
MRHRKKSEKFSRSRAQRKALIHSLLRALLISGRIETTESKAKAIRAHVAKLITWGKRGDLASRRLAYKILGEHLLVKRLFDKIAPQFKDLNGGYTRIIDLRHRKGDGALLSIVELVRREVKKPKKKSKVRSEGKEKTS